MATKEKLSKNERFTLIIASIALLLTLLQFIFSIPCVSNLLYSPNIIGERLDDKCSNRIFESTFLIKNSGNKIANNLMVNMTISKKSKVQIIPNTLYEIKERKNGEPLQDIIVKATHFIPNENILIIVYTDSSSFYKMKADNDSIVIPMLGIIKHDDGFGKILKK